MNKINILLAGNPNVGKSTIFNHLTGLNQHVGNWPGKTVEQKTGSFKHKECECEITDLPGNYSITAYSIEEVVSRDAILNENSDVIINVLDAENIQRNLYLTMQILETGANVVLALNMMKYAEEKGLKINVKELEKRLGIPVKVIDARSGEGIDELIDTAINSTKNPRNVAKNLSYGLEIDEHMTDLKKEFTNVKWQEAIPSWIVIKLLEGDKEITKIVEESPDAKNLNKLKEIQEHLEDVLDDTLEDAFIDARYAMIDGLIKKAVKKPPLTQKEKTDRIDDIVTNKWLGIPIFLFVVWLLFQLTFTIGTPLQDLIDTGFGMLVEYLTPLLPEGWISSLVLNGVIGGVGGVITFLPIIFILFLLLSIIEDCGYLARAAFVVDRFMHEVMGLSGKAFIPMILGFGCDVPGIMATRTLANESDRLTTMLALPFISCSARIPIYALFTAVFFQENQGTVTFGLYLLGMLVAIIVSIVLKRTTFKGETAPFIMELPPYRLPTVKTSLLHMWERGAVFLKKAGTIILATSLLVWLLSNLPLGVEEASESSLIGIIGNFIAPIFAPLGFGDWQSSVALLFGLMAKELVLATFGSLFGVDADTGLQTVLPTLYTPLSALSFMIFTLLYVPCFATLSAIKQESNSWKWMFVSAGLCIGISWIVSFVVYQGGMLLGFG
ncbi:MAG: ferrous iron transport protein B [Methanobacteriaceae archaeon]|nr:ferrous iron transport protein B [Methanobacteriaceae archaeon]